MDQLVDERFLGSLASDLAAADSGLDFIYHALDRVREQAGLDDAVAVIDVDGVDRQIFRSGRRPVQGFVIPGVIEHAVAGVYADPANLDVHIADAVANMCSVAFRLDLATHDASHDGLTGLYNRRTFDILLAQAVSRSQRYGWAFALVLLDLDGFKRINDRLGHEVGDQVLRVLGNELRQSLRAGDVAARVGGDEFALLLANGGPEMASSLVDRVEATVNDVLVDASVGFSAGVAVAPDEASDVGAIYRLADSRLYASKAR
jgi:diguanylate cyclase (GGDEF)-like protein